MRFKLNKNLKTSEKLLNATSGLMIATGLLITISALTSSMLAIPGNNDWLFRLFGVTRNTQINISATILAVALFLHSSTITFLKTPSTQYTNTKYVIVFFLGLSSAIGSSAISIVWSTIQTDAALVITTYCVTVLGIQALLIRKLLKLKWTRNIHTYLMAAILIINLGVTTFGLNERFVSSSLSARTAILSWLFLLLALTLAAYIRSRPHIGKTIVVMSIITAAPLTLSQDVSLYSRELGPTDEYRAVLDQYRAIKLEHRPDIHLISFDSLVPSDLAKELLNVNHIAYESLNARTEYLRFENVFVSDVPTLRSLNSIMRFSDPRAHSLGHFSGITESPLGVILKSNNYDLYSGYSNTGLGVAGKHIDDFYPSAALVFSLLHFCQWTQKNTPFLFWGGCRIMNGITAKNSFTNWEEQLPKRLRRITTKAGENPIFTFHYIGMPSHTGPNYDFENNDHRKKYATEFQRGSEKFMNKLSELEKILTESNRKKIVLIFGDHGMFISRKLDSGSRFEVVDRHGVLLLAIENTTPCSKQDLNYYSSNEFSTVERTIASLIRCLSSAPQLMDRTVTFQEKYNFENFTYE